jgi:outer membrane immunogenic protein
LYVGAHAGWGHVDTDASTTWTPVGFGDPFTYSHDGNGFLAGGQIGFNYQIANWVVGIEADLSWTDIGSTTTVAPLTAGGIAALGSSHTSSFDMNWFGTVRGRLGFAANNLLIYATGGFAFGEFEYATVTADPLGSGLLATSGRSVTRTGWTVGAGAEWGFAPNWSLKAEYLYFDLGDITGVAVDPVAAPAVSVTTNFDNTGHILRLGVNYRFGGGPVVARY